MKFIIGFLVTIGLLIFVFVMIFKGGSDTKAEEIKMLDYANSSIYVQLTTEGPVNADQTHKSSRVTVTNAEATVEVFQGYEKTLLDSKSYANNSAAYADFLRALDLAGYTKGNISKAAADERGYCATGYRYIMNIKDGDKDIQRYWATSCGVGTFKGKTQLVRDLFAKQIPDHKTFTSVVYK